MSIQISIAQAIKPRGVLIYGAEGLGKTTLTATDIFPKELEEFWDSKKETNNAGDHPCSLG
ncbi:MAG: hypothetical protein LUG99_09220 [Lachnospiraceae bacterium]|nr:hypothetical protein [Lachnospiraceae bacterium]